MNEHECGISDQRETLWISHTLLKIFMETHWLKARYYGIITLHVACFNGCQIYNLTTSVLYYEYELTCMQSRLFPIIPPNQYKCNTLFILNNGKLGQKLQIPLVNVFFSCPDCVSLRLYHHHFTDDFTYCKVLYFII